MYALNPKYTCVRCRKYNDQICLRRYTLLSRFCIHLSPGNDYIYTTSFRRTWHRTNLFRNTPNDYCKNIFTLHDKSIWIPNNRMRLHKILSGYVSFLVLYIFQICKWCSCQLFNTYKSCYLMINVSRETSNNKLKYQ